MLSSMLLTTSNGNDNLEQAIATAEAGPGLSAELIY